MVHIDIRQEKVGFPVVRLRKKGIFDLYQLYKELAGWFKEYNYIFTEKGYTRKAKGGYDDCKFEWKAHRDITDYFKFNLEVEFYILRCRNVKIDNKILQKMEIELTFKTNYEKNYKKTFKSEWMRRIYETYFIRGKIDKMEGKLLGEFNDLIKKAKDIFEMVKA